MMTKGRQQSSVPTLKLTPLPSPFSCKVALAAPWGWRNLARKGGGEGGGATSPQDLAFNKFRPQKLDFEKLGMSRNVKRYCPVQHHPQIPIAASKEFV